jgi:bd-type cytochrome oxidase subunit I
LPFWLQLAWACRHWQACSRATWASASRHCAQNSKRNWWLATIAYHYLFPQFTMGLALLLVILKTLYLWRKDERFNVSTHFWGKIFAVTFVLGVVTGIPKIITQRFLARDSSSPGSDWHRPAPV